MVEDFNFVSILPALIGAISGSFGGNVITDWLRHREEKERLRENITNKYLIQLQYAVESLWFRFYNMRSRGGPSYMSHIKGSNEYYVVSTLYALGGASCQRILLFEGIYSQIESIYPQFGNWLLSKYNELGNKLDTIVIKTPKLVTLTP